MMKNSKRKLMFTTLFLILLMISSTLTTLIANAHATEMNAFGSSDKKEQIRERIEAGFENYLTARSIKTDGSFPSFAFKAFLYQNPTYKTDLDEYNEIIRAEDFAKFSSIPDVSAIADEGPVYKTTTIAQNGEDVKVNLSNGTMSNGVHFTKATLCTNGTDPWIYIMTNKISIQILLWTINYGEHQYVGMVFPNYGNGTNEGTTFMEQVDDWASDKISYNDFVSFIASIALGVTGLALPGDLIAGTGTYVFGTLLDAGWNNLRSAVIDTYDDTHGVWFCMENWWIYPWWATPVGAQHYYTRNWDDYPQTGPWEEVSGMQITWQDVATGGLANACVVADFIKTAGDTYGYNQWIQLRYDQTPKIIDPPYPCTITVLGYDDYSGTPVGLCDVYVDSQFVGTVDAWEGLSFVVDAGEHTIYITNGYNTYGDSYMYPVDFWYFDVFWNYDYNNPITVTTSNDVTVIAHFYPP